jgi:2',3'-cyclic-nucleotide 2'-phosphodiesterase (5'-nucleotidase family)
LGRLDLQVDVAGKRIVSHEWKRIAIEPGVFKPDPEVAALVAHWEAKVSEVVDVPIGTSKRRIARKEELKPLIEQIMREATGADLAYMNEGGIRDAIPEGEIRARHVWNLEPFGNLIAFGRLKGSQLPPEMAEGRRIDPNRDYLVATNDFTAEKWAEQGIQLDERGEEIRELMIAWIKRKKVIE